MKQTTIPDRIDALAVEIDAQVRALISPNTASVRALRRMFTRRIQEEPADFVIALALRLIEQFGYRSIANELVRYHKPAFSNLDEASLKALGQGINSWWSVDDFARTLSGPAWLRGNISAQTIHKWAASDDFWWRRAALVSTVALNTRSQGGPGDIPRTLAVCRLLVSDHEDMVVKAMSWALRELVVHDPDAVRQFLMEHDDVLAARVKREVINKLNTGLKNPR
jgi:3-methyladenine DNA glycosylase AlkD